VWRGRLAGVEIDPPRRAVQEFLLRQHDAGMLLCVCSKNDQADVFDVFRSPSGHAPASRAHRRLARELGAQVRQRPGAGGRAGTVDPTASSSSTTAVEAGRVERAAGVVPVRLPDDPGLRPAFPGDFWAFDHFTLTAEDRRRTELYRRTPGAQELRRDSTSLRSFLHGLDVQVEVGPCSRGTSAGCAAHPATPAQRQPGVALRRARGGGCSTPRPAVLVLEVRDRVLATMVW